MLLLPAGGHLIELLSALGAHPMGQVHQGEGGQLVASVGGAAQGQAPDKALVEDHLAQLGLSFLHCRVENTCTCTPGLLPSSTVDEGIYIISHSQMV